MRRIRRRREWRRRARLRTEHGQLAVDLASTWLRCDVPFTIEDGPDGLRVRAASRFLVPVYEVGRAAVDEAGRPLNDSHEAIVARYEHATRGFVHFVDYVLEEVS